MLEIIKEKRESNSYSVKGWKWKKNNQQVLRHHHQTDRVKKWEKKRGKVTECKRERVDSRMLVLFTILFTKRMVEMGALLFT